MESNAIIFLILAWTVIFSLVGFCYYKVFTTPAEFEKKEE